MNIKQIDDKIEKLQKQKAELLAKAVKRKRKTIIINQVEYELEQHDNNKILYDIFVPKGWRLLLPYEAMMLYERGLIDNSFWFFVKQTNKAEENKGNVAWFGAGSDWAFLGCGGDPSDSGASLGVIFARDLKYKSKSKQGVNNGRN